MFYLVQPQDRTGVVLLPAIQLTFCSAACTAIFLNRKTAKPFSITPGPSFLSCRAETAETYLTHKGGFDASELVVKVGLERHAKYMHANASLST